MEVIFGVAAVEILSHERPTFYEIRGTYTSLYKENLFYNRKQISK